MNEYKVTIYFNGDSESSYMILKGDDFFDAKVQVEQMISKKCAYNAKVDWSEDYE